MKSAQRAILVREGVLEQLKATTIPEQKLVLQALRVLREDPSGKHVVRLGYGLRRIQAGQQMIIFKMLGVDVHVLGVRLDKRRPRKVMPFVLSKAGEVFIGVLAGLLSFWLCSSVIETNSFTAGDVGPHHRER